MLHKCFDVLMFVFLQELVKVALGDGAGVAMFLCAHEHGQGAGARPQDLLFLVSVELSVVLLSVGTNLSSCSCGDALCNVWPGVPVCSHGLKKGLVLSSHPFADDVLPPPDAHLVGRLRHLPSCPYL